MKSDTDNTARPLERIKRRCSIGNTVLSTLEEQDAANTLQSFDSPSNSTKREDAAQSPRSNGMGTSTNFIKISPESSIRAPLLSRSNQSSEKAKDTLTDRGRSLAGFAASQWEPLEVDFASAPSDPAAFSVWVAQRVQAIKAFPPTFTPEARRTKAQRRSRSHNPGIVAYQKAYGASHPEKLSDGRIRDGKARLWKQWWRSRRADTSKHDYGMTVMYTSPMVLPAGTGNDLGSHLGPRAEGFSSEASSEGGHSQIRNQLEKPKAKRNNRERRCESYPASLFPKSQYRKDSCYNGDHEVNTARVLLMNALQPFTSDETAASSKAAASALKNALEDTNTDSRSLAQAMCVLATDSKVMTAIYRSLECYNSSASSSTDAEYCSITPKVNAFMDESTLESANASSPEIRSSSASVTLKLRGGMIMENKSFLKFDQSKSKKIKEAYNVANQILEDTAGRKSPTYITPYGDPQDNYVTPYGPLDAGLDLNAQGNEASIEESGINMAPKIVTHDTSTDQHYDTDDTNDKGSGQDHEIDHAQIDRLLLLAGGGSLNDNDDTDDEVEVLASFTKAEADEDVQAILKQVYETMTSRGGNGTYLPFANKALVGVKADRPNSGLEMEQASNLQSIMEQAGVMKNIIIPKDQGLATSRLYATLVNCAQGSSRLGGILLPHHASNLGPGFIAHAPGPFPTATRAHYANGFGESFPPYGSSVNGGIRHPFHGDFTGGFIPHVIGNQRGFLVPYHSSFYSHLVPNGDNPINVPGPVVQQRPFIPSSMPPPPLPSRIGTARGKTAEEAKKVRDYGFPPLPSSRPGIRAGATGSLAKRKLDD